MYYEVKPMVALLIQKLTADCLWLNAYLNMDILSNILIN